MWQWKYTKNTHFKNIKSINTRKRFFFFLNDPDIIFNYLLNQKYCEKNSYAIKGDVVLWWTPLKKENFSLKKKRRLGNFFNNS